ncbi:MAG: hypothetical protein ACK4VP_06825 [Nitrospira sp.]
MSLTTDLLVLETHVMILKELVRRHHESRATGDLQASLHSLASLMFCVSHTLYEVHDVLVKLSTLPTFPQTPSLERPAESE